jgi:hypothetical protein
VKPRLAAGTVEPLPSRETGAGTLAEDGEEGEAGTQAGEADQGVGTDDHAATPPPHPVVERGRLPLGPVVRVCLRDGRSADVLEGRGRHVAARPARPAQPPADVEVLLEEELGRIEAADRFESPAPQEQ